MKCLKLWFSSREFGRILSGTDDITDDALRNIKTKSGLNITREDIQRFPVFLKSFKPYSGIIYRGVSKQDKIYLQVLSGTEVVTKRYYSCSHKKIFAEMFSSQDNILLVISTKRTFDVSVHSREYEVILDKNITLKVIKHEENVVYLSD